MRSKCIFAAAVVAITLFTISGSYAAPTAPWDDVNPAGLEMMREVIPNISNLPPEKAPGDPVDMDAVLFAGAEYLKGMQADITEDNAGNGNPDVPDDPDDGGWDWVSTTFSHSVNGSPKNIYGATALGLYYAYLESGDASHFTAMTDAATFMITDAGIRSASDLTYLIMYNDLPAVSGTAYADAARAKYDGRITTYGSAQLFAEYIRDVRGLTQGYPNGIIAWDIGLYVKAAAMLDSHYPGNGYDTDADAMAEVIFQDSYMDNPGLFDIVDDAGWDSTFANSNFWWYTLGITGLIDAFDAANVHTSEIPGLITILLNCQYSGGGISGSFGANIGDEDWQSTGYAMMSLGNFDQATYQSDINRMGYWVGATQDGSGGWVYGSGNHYPEIGGECTSGLYFTSNTLTDAIVDDDFTSQSDVDAYNAANSTNYIWGYDAFATIQGGIDAVNGSTVSVEAGTYNETVTIDKTVSVIGAGITQTFVTGGIMLNAGVTGVVLQNLYITGESASSTIIRSMGGNTNFTMDNCVLDGESVAGRFGYGGGSMLGNVSVTNNEMMNVAGWALWDSHSGSGGDGSAMDTITFANNNIHECDGSISFRGLSTDRTDVANVYGNTWTNIGDNFTAPSQHWAAFEMNRTVNFNFYENTISNVALGQWGEGQGLQVWDIDILDVHDNDFINCYQGIWVYGGGAFSVPGGSVYHNDFTGTSDYAVGVDATCIGGGTLDAEANYWGTVDYATISALVQGSVDFDPWCSDATHSNCTLTFLVTEVWIDDDWAGSSGGDLVGGHIFGYNAFATIQDGINGVTGSTVNVAAGIYREQLYVDHSLNLLGAGIGVSIIEAPDPLDRTTYSITQWTGSARTIDAVIGVVAAGNVNISGFTIDGRDVGPDNFYGIHFFDTDGSVTLCEIDNITDAAVPGYSRVVSLAATHSSAQTFTIDLSNNSIPVFQKGGILIMGPGATFTVNQNTVVNVPSPTIAGNGIQLSYGATGTTYQNVVVGAEYTGDDWAATGILLFECGDVSMDGDEVYNCQSGVNYSDWGWVYLHPTPVNLSFTNLNLYDNEWTLGIQLSRDNSDVNMTVTDCDILNSTGDGIDLYCTGVDPWGGSYYTGWDNGDLSATITGCYISGTALDGIWGGDYSGNVNNVSVSVFDCMFTGNTGSAINNGFTQMMDASGCFWDDPTGPTIGVKSGGVRSVMPTVNPFGGTLPAEGKPVSTEQITTDRGLGETIYGSVDYTPWLGGGTQANPGFDGDFSVLYVDDDSPQAGPTGYVQEGIDLVSGSTVNVAGGMYIEQVHITTNDLSLIGSGVDVTTIQSPATLTDFFVTGSNNNFPVIFVDGATNVSVSDLTIDGNGLGNANYRFVGLAFWNSGGSFTDGKVVNIMDTPFSGAQHGVGVYSNNDTDGPYTIVMNDVLVDDFQKTAVAMTGTGLTVDLDSITTIGEGGTSVTAQNGIQIDANVGGTVDDCIISAIAYTGGTWTATGFLNQGNVVATGIDIDQCQTSVYWIDGSGTFDGGTITNPLGDAFYAYNSTTAKSTQPRIQPQPFGSAESAGSSRVAMNVILSNTTITGVGAAFSWGVGVFSTSADPVDLTVTGCTIEDWDVGIFAYDYGGPVNCIVTNGNLIVNNNTGMTTSPTGSIGMTAYGNSFSNVVNAEDSTAGGTWDDGAGTGNCWSDFESNPGYPVNYVIAGSAGAVDNSPAVDCGVDMSPDDIVYICQGNFSLDISVGDIVSGLEAANYAIAYPASLNVASVTAADLNFTVYYSVNDHAVGLDTLFVQLAVNSGATNGPAQLFTIEMNGSSSFCSGTSLEMISVDMRDSTTVPQSIPAPVAAPVSLLSDCEDPILTVNGPVGGGFYNVPPVLDFAVGDDCDIDAIYYQIDGCDAGSWTPIVTAFSGTSYVDAAWTVPGFPAMSEGEHCVRFKAIDDFGRGNSDSCTFTWCFTKDITAPLAPTSLVATPGHNKVKLSWNNATSDFDHTVVMRTDWYAGGHGYPEYGNLNAEGPHPADTAGGSLIVSTVANSWTDTDNLSNATRDIYHYAAFTVDAAGNVSASAGAEARSTSYWLGDISDGTPGSFDGYVYFQDLTKFALGYRTADGDPGFWNQSDFGPTLGDAKGIPIPDDSVQFEDLVIFAINYDAVNPTMKVVPLLPASSGDGVLALSLISEEVDEQLVYTLRLESNVGELKALHAVIQLPDDSPVKGFEIKQALSGSEVPVFTDARQVGGQFVFDVALLGQGQTIGGSGDLLTISMSATACCSEVELIEGQLRDLANNELVVELKNSAAKVIPRSYALHQNYPNPFNPSTSIVFDLPATEQVTIDIYNTLGQKVATLVNERLDAGQHTVVWTGVSDAGQSVASGVYMYRISSGDFHQSRKMILLK